MPKKKNVTPPMQVFTKRRRAQMLRAIRALDGDENLRVARYREAVKSWRGLSSVPRAERWLNYWIDNGRAWGDLEALIYAVSRGKDCKKAIADTIGIWRDAERHSFTRLEEASAGRVLLNVEDYSSFALRNFWGCSDQQELTIDATMLRAADWCGIKGFEPWWRRLAKEIREAAFNGGLHFFALFGFCRSDYAVQNINALSSCLEAIEASSEPGYPPWRHRDGNAGCAPHAAASIAFAYSRLSTNGECGPLADRALDEVRKHFNHRVGAWPSFEGEPANLSVESTAMGLHALRATCASDFEHFSRPARDWLLTQQHQDGYWNDPGAPDPVWLTVLVLDALQLGAGSPNLTFKLPVRPTETSVALRRDRKIFVSYRRDDSKYQARMIYGAFVHVLPSENVFMDINSIPPGRNFRKVLQDKVEKCDILLALIGPDWLHAADPKTKKRRLENPNDFVRVEIAEALTRGIPVVPVLVDGALIPDVDLLPSNLKELVNRQSESVEYRTFDADVERLILKLDLRKRADDD